MTSSPQVDKLPPTDDRDELLAELLGRLIDGHRNNAPVDVDALAREHPAVATELRSLWRAMLVADDIAATAESPNAARGESARGDTSGRLQFPAEFGDYELLQELGRGGMGIVYRARHRGLDRMVALKVLRAAEGAPATETARFRHEALAAARLNHPNVVPVFEVGEYQGQPFFTMQYVAGSTLARRLAEGPLPPREAASILLPICEAIHAAHVQGVLHRDLKPSNILIDVDGRPLVADFGLAKWVDAGQSLTHSGAVLGTPTHMAPEQAAGSRGHAGPASDVYSLGVILYQMLTGRPPFQGATPMETVLMVLDQEPLPPQLINPRADRTLQMIALRCLQKPPELRYESAQALADDLRAYLADEPISARSGRFNQVIARWLGETHHVSVLKHWGLLWMWHSLALLILCLATNGMQWQGVATPWPYVALWVAGLGAWAAIFWALRRRSGPVTFVERQIAHVWAGSVVSMALLFPVELLLSLPALSLSPVLGLVSGSVFLVKASMLTGTFYLQAAALYATALVMALLERWNLPVGISLFGIVSAACFFVPGLKFYRRYRGTEAP